jgi:hypothetical protein
MNMMRNKGSTWRLTLELADSSKSAEAVFKGVSFTDRVVCCLMTLYGDGGFAPISCLPFSRVALSDGRLRNVSLATSGLPQFELRGPMTIGDGHRTAARGDTGQVTASFAAHEKRRA